MRTQLAAFLTLLLVAAAVVVGVLVGGSTILSQPSPLPTRALTIAPSRSPVPVETLAPDALRVFSIGVFPSDYHFVTVGDPGDERILVLDLGAKRVLQLAHFEGSGGFKDARVIESTRIASSELVVVSLRADGPTSRLYVIRPVTGEVRSFTTPKGEQPRLSPDGSTIAVSRNSSDPEQNGLWLLNVSDGLGRRLIDDKGRRATRTVQWSADGKRLSVLIDTGRGRSQLAVVNAAGELTPVGAATDVRWRGNDLIYWDAYDQSPAHLYDTVAGVSRDAYVTTPGFTADRVEVRPRSSELAVDEHSATPPSRIAIYGTGPPTVAVPDTKATIAFWWSDDGTRLYTWTIEFNTSTVTDAFAGTVALQFCFRQRIVPPCPQ